MTPGARRMVAVRAVLAVGGLNTAVGFGLFALFVRVGLGPTGALAAATVCGVIFNYQSIGRLVFAGGGGGGARAFVLVYLVQFCLNAAALRTLLAMGIGPLIAQALLVPVFAVGSFLAMSASSTDLAPRPKRFARQDDFG